MPITIKKNVMAYKDPTSNDYVGVDAVNDATLEERIGAVETALPDKYEKPANGIPASDIASGVIPDVSCKTDHGAVATPYTSLTWPVTEGKYCFYNGYVYRAKQDISTSESWTAAHWDQVVLGDEVSDVKTAIQGKPDDVQINGVSIVNNGIANIPFASNSAVGAVKLNSLYGIQAIMNSQGQYDGTIAIRKASDQDIQYGSNELKPIVPQNQHTSIYYALSKLAGVDLANETVTVGQFPNNSLVAIQKMLGIYESPWELIREDTFTNASEADHDISVDGNGNTFELTDVILLFETPVQNNTASKGQYGLFQFFDGDSNIINAYCAAWTQNANADAKGTIVSVTKQKGGLYTVTKTEPHTKGNSYMYEYITSGLTGKASAIILDNNLKITKIRINTVTGTGHYILYGKRKWN